MERREAVDIAVEKTCKIGWNEATQGKVYKHTKILSFNLTKVLH